MENDNNIKENVITDYNEDEVLEILSRSVPEDTRKKRKGS
ncbi:38518_t:CDS:2 [Gigaspora margarita]|uniref:38518_t:CDS:1 n=1 Tax=Gigaspora margarita TaxID=4874 RepID=A0ABN7VBB3_GIGMA|nr:38518_t:CDS:2 [Gigaspora margarita]